MQIFNFTCTQDCTVNYNFSEFNQFLSDNFKNFKHRLNFLTQARANRTIEEVNGVQIFKSFVEINFPTYKLRINIVDKIKENC